MEIVCSVDIFDIKYFCFCQNNENEKMLKIILKAFKNIYWKLVLKGLFKLLVFSSLVCFVKIKHHSYLWNLYCWRSWLDLSYWYLSLKSDRLSDRYEIYEKKYFYCKITRILMLALKDGGIRVKLYFSLFS